MASASLQAGSASPPDINALAKVAASKTISSEDPPAVDLSDGNLVLNLQEPSLTLKSYVTIQESFLPPNSQAISKEPDLPHQADEVATDAVSSPLIPKGKDSLSTFSVALRSGCHATTSSPIIQSNTEEAHP